MNIITIGLGCGFGGYAAYALFTSALSDTLGLQTLRHGTGPCNYLSIQTNGARPDLGSIASGETTISSTQRIRKWRANFNKNRFFVWNDDFNEPGQVTHPSQFVKGSLNSPILHPFVKRIGAKYYCIQGGMSALTFREAPTPLRIFMQSIGAIAGLLTPIIDFHITPEEYESQFQVDQNLVPVARSASNFLNSWKYIGLSGVLYQGVNREVFSRIKQDPSRFLKGVAKFLLLTTLVLSILSVISTYGQAPGLINIYSLIANASGSATILIPLSAGLGISLPFICLAIT